MANEKEIIKVVDLLLSAYPHYKPRSIDSMIDLWVDKFRDTNAETLQEAANLHIDDGTFFPAIHDIKAQLPTAEYNILNKLGGGKQRVNEGICGIFRPESKPGWNTQTQETKDFWTQMMKEDGREMVAPGVWGPSNERSKYAEGWK